LESPPRDSDERLSPEDLETLRLLAAIGRKFQRSPSDEALRMVFARIEALAQQVPADRGNDPVIFSLQELETPVLAPTVSQDVLLSVTRALREGRSLLLHYQSAHAHAPRRRRVDPWGLFQKARVWYLIGWCHLRRDRRMFALHRADAAKVLEDPLAVPRPVDFSLAHWASRESWELPMHDPIEVTLELDEVAAGLRQTRLRSGEASLQGPDGTWQVRVRVTNLEPLIGLMLSLWGHGRVLAPADVRSRFEATVDRLIRDHAEESPR